MPTVFQDFRHAFRQIRRAPGFFASACLLIALGVAASTVIFSLVDAVLLKKLPVRDPDTLVQLFELHPIVPVKTYFDDALLRNIRAHSTTLAGVVGQMEMTVSLEHAGVVDRVHPHRVTDEYFSSLGISAAQGRLVTEGDEQVAVLSHAYWLRSFGADAKAIGQTIHLYDRPFTIVGVAPESFSGTEVDSGADLWIPLRSSYNPRDLPGIRIDEAYTDRSPMEILGRLRPGVTLAQAQAEAVLFWSQHNQELIRQDPSEKGYIQEGRLELRSISRGTSTLRDQSSTALWLLFAGTGLLLLMVASNVGGLLLARAGVREKETAVMLAIGAPRLRIVRLWFIEGLLLALAGGALGTLAASLSIPALVRWLPPARGIGYDPAELRTRTLALHLDLRILAFSIAISVLIAVLASIAPAWRSAHRDLWTSLKIAIGDSRHRRFQAALAALQVGLSIVLLVCAGLVVRNLNGLRSVNTGFDQDHLAIFSIDTLTSRYTTEQAASLSRRLIDGARGLPGVEAAAVAGRPLMRGIGVMAYVIFPDRPPEGRLNSSLNVVSPEYFETMGMRIVAGRGFDASALKLDPPPAVVNEAFAKQFFAGRNPIGQVFGTGRKWEKPKFQIVGVVSDTKYRSLRETPPPIYYAPGPPDSFVLHVRTKGDPEALIPAVRQLIRSADPRLIVYEVATLQQEIDRSLWQERMLVALGTLFGTFSTLLAAMGLYGMLAYFVTIRRREIGLRMALGARPAHVSGLLVKQLAPAIAAGLALGAALSVGAGIWIGSLLYKVKPSDPQTIGGSLMIVLLTVVCAAAFPVWRALRLDPASTLREE